MRSNARAGRIERLRQARVGAEARKKVGLWAAFSECNPIHHESLQGTEPGPSTGARLFNTPPSPIWSPCHTQSRLVENRIMISASKHGEFIGTSRFKHGEFIQMHTAVFTLFCFNMTTQVEPVHGNDSWVGDIFTGSF